MKRLLVSAFIAIAFSLGGVSSSLYEARAQQADLSKGVRPHNLSASEISRIVRAFSEKETRFRQALNNYSFKRDATVQTVGMGGQITGEYQRVSQFVFDDASRRFERITYFPAPTLTEITLTTEDLEDLGGVQPFALEAAKIDQYDFNFLGKERIDELDLYVFDVTPKRLSDLKKTKERFFQGRIWVDDKDLQIVKARGKGVPEGKQRFPVFETYREQVDGKYWFPTYTYADDTLVFDSGQAVHVRMRVKYVDYKELKGKVEVIFDDSEPTPDETQPATSTPAKQP